MRREACESRAKAGGLVTETACYGRLPGKWALAAEMHVLRQFQRQGEQTKSPFMLLNTRFNRLVWTATHAVPGRGNGASLTHMQRPKTLAPCHQRPVPRMRMGASVLRWMLARLPL